MLEIDQTLLSFTMGIEESAKPKMIKLYDYATPKVSQYPIFLIKLYCLPTPPETRAASDKMTEPKTNESAVDEDMLSKPDSNPRPKVDWNPLALELHTAIKLLVICWDILPGGLLANIQIDLEKYPHIEPFDWKIKIVNSIIGKGKRPLPKMLSTLRKDNPDLQYYQFPYFGGWSK